MDKCFTSINAKQILIKTLGVGIFKSHEIDSTTKKNISTGKGEHFIKLLFHQESLVLNSRALMYVKQN